MSYKTRTKKRVQRRRQKQARAANAQLDELFRKREAWRARSNRSASTKRREPAQWPRTQRRCSAEAVGPQ